MTERQTTALQLLRQERHPLAILALLAVGLRVSLMMIGLSLSPEVAASGLGLLCQPSVLEGESTPRSVTHDPAHCICGPSCIHLGQQAAAPPGTTPWLSGLTSEGIRLAGADSNSNWPVSRLAQALIRGPPSFLT